MCEPKMKDCWAFVKVQKITAPEFWLHIQMWSRVTFVIFFLIFSDILVYVTNRHNQCARLLHNNRVTCWNTSDQVYNLLIIRKRQIFAFQKQRAVCGLFQMFTFRYHVSNVAMISSNMQPDTIIKKVKQGTFYLWICCSSICNKIFFKLKIETSYGNLQLNSRWIYFLP